jgi:hypothetical protein
VRVLLDAGDSLTLTGPAVIVAAEPCAFDVELQPGTDATARWER